MGERIMSKHHLRIEEEFFRTLFIEGNAYHKQKIAKRFGVSASYFDKIYRDIKQFFEETYPGIFESHRRDKEAYSRFKYDAYKLTENILIWFYRQTRQKKYSEEIERYVLILKILSEKSKTRDEILEELEFFYGDTDIKLSRYLNPLIELKILTKTKIKRLEYFTINHTLFEELTIEEIKGFYCFVLFLANTGISSVPGYFLLDTLKSYLRFIGVDEELDLFVFRDNNFTRILDEYKLLELKEAIQAKQFVTFYYFSKTNKKRAFAKTDEENRRVSTIPIKLLYDHQYGRWYLIGVGQKRNEIQFYKLEGISDVQVQVERVEEEKFALYQTQIDHHLKHSWLLKPNKLINITIKFHKQQDGTDRSLIERINREKRWGNIVEETNDYLLVTIEVNGTSEITPWIRSFGPQAEVIERFVYEIP
jgi:predicted DNA-binding transcriptional regulator YafY